MNNSKPKAHSLKQHWNEHLKDLKQWDKSDIKSGASVESAIEPLTLSNASVACKKAAFR